MRFITLNDLLNSYAVCALHSIPRDRLDIYLQDISCCSSLWGSISRSY